MHSQSPGQMLTPTEEIPSQSRLQAPPAAKGSPCTCAAAHPPAPVVSASPVSLTLGWRLVCREEKEKGGDDGELQGRSVEARWARLPECQARLETGHGTPSTEHTAHLFILRRSSSLMWPGMGSCAGRHSIGVTAHPIAITVGEQVVFTPYREGICARFNTSGTPAHVPIHMALHMWRHVLR